MLQNWKTINSVCIGLDDQIHENSPSLDKVEKRIEIFVQKIDSNIYFDNFDSVLLFYLKYHRKTNILSINTMYQFMKNTIDNCSKKPIFITFSDYSEIVYEEFVSPLNIIKNTSFISLVLTSLRGELGKANEIMADLSKNYAWLASLTIFDKNVNNFNSKEEYEKNKSNILEAIKNGQMSIMQNNVNNKYLVNTIIAHLDKEDLHKFFRNNEELKKFPYPDIINNI